MTHTIRFWTTVLTVVSAVVFYAAFPRYQLATGGLNHMVLYRFDRWTGRVEVASTLRPSATWITNQLAAPNP